MEHDCPQNCIHARLVASARCFEPRNNIFVQANRGLKFAGFFASDSHRRFPKFIIRFWNVGKINFAFKAGERCRQTCFACGVWGGLPDS